MFGNAYQQPPWLPWQVKMEQATSISPTSKIKDLRRLFGYFKDFQHDKESLIYLKLPECQKILRKYIDFIMIIANEKFYCVEVYYEDLDSLWKSANYIKTASANYTSALNDDNDYEKIIEFINLLILKCPNDHVKIGEAYRPIDTNYSAEISKYVEIGKLLCETDCITKIRDEIKNLEHNREDPSSYAAIVGPSFTGKTQTAFTLSHLMDVFYVNIASVKDYKDNIENADSGLGGFQDIYSKFNKISTVFLEILRTDVFNCNLEYEDSHTASKLSQPLNRKYLLLGFILLLVRWKKLLNLKDPIQWFHRYRQVNRVIIPKLSIDEFNQKCIGKQSCFFLTSFNLL